MKLITGLSFCVLMVATAPAAAQETGQAAFDRWIENNREAGLTLRYDTATRDGDRVVFTNPETSVKVSFRFEDGDGESTVVDIDYADSAPRLVATNLAHNGEGLSADRMEFDGALEFDIEIAIDGNTVLTYAGNVEDYALSGVFWPQMQPMPKTLKGSLKAWVSWFASMADYRIDKASAGSMSARFFSTEEAGVESAFVSEMEIDGFELQGMWNGRIESYSIGNVRQETSYNLDNGAPYSERVTIDSSDVRNLDFLALLDLFDPKPAGASEYAQVLESASTSGYRAESDLYEFYIERMSYENFAVRSPETDFLALVEQALAGQEPSEGEVMFAVLDLYRAFSFGSFSMQDMLIKFDANAEVGSGGIGSMTVTDLSSEGLEEFAMENVEFDAGAQGRFKLGKFAIGNVEFSPYGPVKAFVINTARWQDPDPLDVATIFSPRSIAMELSNLSVVSPDLAGSILLDTFEMELDSSVPPVPTQVVLNTEGLELPVAFLNDREVEGLLKSAGIDVLRLTENITVKWDEETEDLAVENFVFDMGQVGRVEARARLGGLQRSILENPQQIQAAIATLNVKSFEIELQNQGGVEAALTLSARDADVSEGMIKEALLMQLDGALGQIGNDAFTQQVMAAARAFFENPGNLRLRIAPDNPVPVVQIMSDAMIAPDALPERLGVTVEVNR